MSDRFKCLKPESDNTFRKNRFQNNRLKNDNNRHINSRWQRSKSPDKKFNSFTSRGRGRGGGWGGRGQGRGRRNFRNNRRSGPSKKFHNIQKDEKGRPMILGATNNSFNPFEVALQKKNQKNIVIKKKEKQENKKENMGFEKSKMTDAEKQMILNMQYETDSEEEEDEISQEDDN
tara:strand:+ start:8442 stop:8966 length:525 start_codon:yes stop_codon:yes gene_type:complete